MNDIITTSVKLTDPADVLDAALCDAIANADDQALVAGLLQSGVRLADHDTDALEKLAATARKVVKGDALPALLAVAHQIDPDTHVVTPDQAIWIMDWSQRNEDGTRKYADKPEREEVFEEAKGLALLLINEVVHLNSHHWMAAWPKDARKTLHLGVDCSDVFAWGCSDSEDATYEDIEDVYRHWVKDPRWGCAVWSMIRRGQMPQGPVAKRIRDAGIWDLDALRMEHGLLANHYDGVSGVQAGQKYEAYRAWTIAEGGEPLPYDAKWWDGWRLYVAANPGWHDDQWKAEEARRRLAWRTENGYETAAVEPETREVYDLRAEGARLANMVEAAAEKRKIAAMATDASAKSFLNQVAAGTERDVLAALPALLAAMSADAAVAA